MGVESIRFCPVFLPFFLNFFMIVTHLLSSCSIENTCFYYKYNEKTGRICLFLFPFALVSQTSQKK